MSHSILYLHKCFFISVKLRCTTFGTMEYLNSWIETTGKKKPGNTIIYVMKCSLKQMNVRFSTKSPSRTGTSQRAGKLTEHFKGELSPGGQLLPPVGDLVQLLRIGQQHFLGSLPQVHSAVSVSQDEPVLSNSKIKHTRQSSDNLSTMLVVLRVSTSHCSQSLLRPGTT